MEENFYDETDYQTEGPPQSSSFLTQQATQKNPTEKTSTKKERKLQFRFNKDIDLALIVEVENLKPFLEARKQATELWKRVAEVVSNGRNGEIDHLRAKLRFELLLKKFKSDDFRSTYKSGTEEEVTIIKQKLADLNSIIADQKKTEQQNEEQEIQKSNYEKAAAEEIREAALSTRRKRDSDENGTAKRLCDKGLMELERKRRK